LPPPPAAPAPCPPGSRAASPSTSATAPLRPRRLAVKPDRALSGIFRAQTGSPLQVGEPSAIAASRPDLLDAQAAINTDYRQTRQYLNAAAFGILPKSPVSGATLRPGTYGNNALRGPGFWLLDLSVARNFALPRNSRLQLRADLFNALNHVNYTSVVTSVEARNFGQLTETTGPRVIQLNTLGF
jgi:hypothetical protein